jgi:hypothetical protein
MASLLPPPRMRLAHALAVALAVLAAGLNLVGLFYYDDQLRGHCLQAECQLGLIQAPRLADLAAAGLSVPAYALSVVAIESAALLVYFAAAGLILWRAPGNAVALLGAVFLVSWGSSTTNFLAALVEANAAWRLPMGLLGFVALTSLFAFFSVFPSGRFVPRQMRLVLIAWAAVSLVIQLSNNDDPISDNFWLLCGAVTGFFGFLASIVLAQIYRYYRVSSPAQRQQTKWVVFGLAVAISGLIALMWIGAWYSPMPEPRAVYSLGYHLAFHAVSLALPISIMAAVLQSGLWSIDLIIRGTLVYTVLTGALGAVYLASVLLLQTLFQWLTGQRQSELVTVVSTLAIAGLFFPVRARVQSLIDRRFYRRKYDAAQTVAAFGLSLRNEVDLGALGNNLTAVVQDTMQPAHVSLWLMQDVRGRPGSYDEVDRR